MVQDNTAGSYAGIGDKETDDDPAELRLIGDGNIRLIDISEIKNGDFESGSLVSWNPSGDIRVVQKLQTLKVPQGLYMALLTTGVSAVDDSTSILSQKIRPTSTKHTLKFRYNFVSEEPEEFLNSAFDDKFELIVENNIKMLESVNSSTWIHLGDDYFPEGDSTTYHTGWKEYSIDLKEYIGQLIELRYKVYDVGDSAYDSAVLLYDIRLE